MSDEHGVHPTYGVPRDMISCPSCGRLYTNKVCIRCEECRACCKKTATCRDPIYIDAGPAKEWIAENESMPREEDIQDGWHPVRPETTQPPPREKNDD